MDSEVKPPPEDPFSSEGSLSKGNNCHEFWPLLNVKPKKPCLAHSPSPLDEPEDLGWR